MLSILPFIFFLLTIALAPIIIPVFWGSNRNKFFVTLIYIIPTSIYLLANGHITELSHSVIEEYIPFVILISTFFVLAEGIFFSIRFSPSTRNLVVFYAGCAILSSFIGTIACSVIFIKPLIDFINLRRNKKHIILFFISIASNCGGLLTPLGDPPLFMLYLKGLQFQWFFGLFPEWLLANSLIIMCFIIWDKKLVRQEENSIFQIKKQKFEINGFDNLFLMVIVILTIAFSPTVLKGSMIHLREFILLSILLISLFKSRFKSIKIDWHPVIETATIFLGIFLTLVPTVIYIKNNLHLFDDLNAQQFFYLTGFMSSFLDNAPTALTFFSIAFLKYTGLQQIPENILRAICTASVFFGSLTYIGNAPNLLVKSIAEKRDIDLPEFFGYMFKFSFIILLPIFIICQLLFLN